MGSCHQPPVFSAIKFLDIVNLLHQINSCRLLYQSSHPSSKAVREGIPAACKDRLKVRP